MAILHDPILIGDGDDRVVKVHCGTPGEQCNVDEAKYKQKVPWNTAFMAIILEVMRAGEGTKRDTLHELMCDHCFGGEWLSSADPVAYEEDREERDA